MHLFIYVSSFASVGCTVCTTYHNVHVYTQLERGKSSPKNPFNKGKKSSGEEAEEMTVDSSDAEVKYNIQYAGAASLFVQ